MKSKLPIRLILMMVSYVLFLFVYFSFQRYTHSPKLVYLFLITLGMNVIISFFVRKKIFYFLLIIINSLFLLIYFSLFMHFEFNSVIISIKTFFFCLGWYIVYGNWIVPLLIREFYLLFGGKR